MNHRYTRATLSANTESGFTLLELMIVVVIVGFLATVAYPSFRDQAIRSTRAEAKAALADAAARQEQFFLDNKTYANSLALIDMVANTENGHYQISVDAPTAGCPITRCYGMRATPQGGQSDDSACATLTITSNGTKGATGPDGADCW